jgi:hypothetical protein
MNTVTGTIDPRRIGFAGGATGVVLYLGCVLTTATVSHDRAIAFFNALAHWIDVGPILRHSVPLGKSFWESLAPLCSDGLLAL